MKKPESWSAEKSQNAKVNLLTVILGGSVSLAVVVTIIFAVIFLGWKHLFANELWLWFLSIIVVTIVFNKVEGIVRRKTTNNSDSLDD